MKVAVFYNPAAGVQRQEDVAAEISRHFAVYKVAAEIVALPPSGLAASIAQRIADGVDVVVAAGGDGTISSVAAALIDTPVPLGILPVGTLNHFAKDLGLPLDLAGAVRTIMEGQRRRVDVGEVNGRIFVNNSSIGMYPVMVRDRDERRAAAWSEQVDRTAARLVSGIQAIPPVHRCYP